MCTTDDSHLTLEFDEHYVISPAITFSGRGNNYLENNLKEKGIPVSEGFEYHSGRNEYFLSIDEIIKFNSNAENL